jgi:hypothetical protein
MRVLEDAAGAVEAGEERGAPGARWGGAACGEVLRALTEVLGPSSSPRMGPVRRSSRAAARGETRRERKRDGFSDVMARASGGGRGRDAPIRCAGMRQ